MSGVESEMPKNSRASRRRKSYDQYHIQMPKSLSAPLSNTAAASVPELSVSASPVVTHTSKKARSTPSRTTVSHSSPEQSPQQQDNADLDDEVDVDETTNISNNNNNEKGEEEALVEEEEERQEELEEQQYHKTTGAATTNQKVAAARKTQQERQKKETACKYRSSMVTFVPGQARMPPIGRMTYYRYGFFNKKKRAQDNIIKEGDRVVDENGNTWNVRLLHLSDNPNRLQLDCDRIKDGKTESVTLYVGTITHIDSIDTPNTDLSNAMFQKKEEEYKKTIQSSSKSNQSRKDKHHSDIAEGLKKPDRELIKSLMEQLQTSLTVNQQLAEQVLALKQQVLEVQNNIGKMIKDELLEEVRNQRDTFVGLLKKNKKDK